MSDDIRASALGKRIINCLLNEGIKTITELKKKDKIDLLKIPGVGRKGLAKIQLLLSSDKNEYDRETKNILTINEIKKVIFNSVYEAIHEYMKNGYGRIMMKDMIETSLKTMQEEIHSTLFRNINELRTIVLEQSRILEGMQSISRPDGIIGKISEKVPGFNTMIHDLYKVLEK